MPAANRGHTHAIKNTETPESLWGKHIQRMKIKNILLE